MDQIDSRELKDFLQILANKVLHKVIVFLITSVGTVVISLSEPSILLPSTDGLLLPEALPPVSPAPDPLPAAFSTTKPAFPSAPLLPTRPFSIQAPLPS